MDNQAVELVLRQNQLFKELAAIDQNIAAMKDHRSACIISINQTERKLEELTEKAPKEEAATPGDIAPANPRKAILSGVPSREEAVAVAEATHIVEDMKKTRKEKTPC